MNYNEYIGEKIRKEDSFWPLAVPVFGWIVSAYYFGIHYPIGYMFRKRSQHLCPDCQKAMDEKNVSKKKFNRNSIR